MQTSHWRQYPPNTTTVYSYFESRGGKFDEVTFFGLQYIIKRYLTGQVVTKEKIDAAEEVINALMGLGEMKHFNREGWEYILKEHGGKLPIIIKAVPEGTTVPNKNVLMTVVNTDPKCYWLTNYLETLLVQARARARARMRVRVRARARVRLGEGRWRAAPAGAARASAR